MVGSYQVIRYFKSGKRRTTGYQSEQGALRAIWKWLREQPDADRAVCMFPEAEPYTIDDWRELPFAEPDAEKDFYRSVKWLRLRMQAFERYGNRCSCCGATAEDGVHLHVDHIKPRSTHPELALDLENLQILCDACNLGKSNLSEKQWR